MPASSANGPLAHWSIYGRRNWRAISNGPMRKAWRGESRREFPRGKWPVSRRAGSHRRPEAGNLGNPSLTHCLSPDLPSPGFWESNQLTSLGQSHPYFSSGRFHRGLKRPRVSFRLTKERGTRRASHWGVQFDVGENFFDL